MLREWRRCGKKSASRLLRKKKADRCEDAASPLHMETSFLPCQLTFPDGTQMTERLHWNATIADFKESAGKYRKLPPESLGYFVICPHGEDMTMAEDHNEIQSYPEDDEGVRHFNITKIAKGIDDLRFLRESESYRKISFAQDKTMYTNGRQMIEYRHVGEQEVDRTESYVPLTAFSIGAQVDGLLDLNDHQFRNLITENTPPEVEVTEDFVGLVRNFIQSDDFPRKSDNDKSPLTVEDLCMIAFESELTNLPYANCSIWEVTLDTLDWPRGGLVELGICPYGLLFLDKENKVVFAVVEFGRIRGGGVGVPDADHIDILFTVIHDDNREGVHDDNFEVVGFNAGQFFNEIALVYSIYGEIFARDSRRILNLTD